MKPSKRSPRGRLPFRYRLLLGFAIPLAVWVAIAVLNIYALNHSIQSSDRLVRSQHATLLANEYMTAVLHAQIGERSYIITGDETFLVPYNNALEHFSETHTQLVRMQGSSPEQREQLQHAGDLFQRWIYDVANPLIDARRKLSPAEANLAHELNQQLLRLQDAHIGGVVAAAGQDAMPEAGTAELIEVMRETMQALATSARQSERTERWQQAQAQLDAYETAIVKNDLPAATAAIHRLVATVVVITREIIALEADIMSRLTSGQGRYLGEEFRDTMTLFIAAEQERLLEDQRVTTEAARRARLLVWAGPALGLLLMIIVAGRIGRRTGRSLENIISATNRLAQGDMEARAGGAADGEIATLAERFNAMAELVESRAQESAALAEFAELLQSCKTSEEIAQMFGRMAERLFADCPGALYLVTPNRDDTVAMTFWRNGEEYSQAHFQPDDCWALRLGRSQENYAQQTVRCNHLLSPPSSDERESLCVPLHAFGETIGILFVTEPCAAHAEDPSDHRQHTRFISTVAEQLALALANLKLRETLRDQSIRDSLTHLYNRRYLDEILQREMHRAGRQEIPLSVLIFDIDHFKRFNDTYGHDGGDRLLEVIGDTLLDFYRTEDTAFRIGGEEFAVLLPGTSLDDALVRADELRQAIRKLKITHGNIVLPSVTVSIGVASHPEHGKTPDDLIKAADTALYRAKENGRNQVQSSNGNT
ncbi:MAG TPA: diguanylate cyclase [Gammaproteobacteria bacterium]